MLETPATAGQRISAYFLDFATFAPVMLLNYYVGGDSPEAGMVANVTNAGLWLGYVVVCHAWFGKTFGKHLMRIRVVRTDGEPLGFVRAGARSVVDIGLTMVTEAGAAIALGRVSEQAYAAERWWFRPVTAQGDLAPGWSEVAEWLWIAWAAGSFVFLALQRRKRAPHDLIAGSEVVQERR